APSRARAAAAAAPMPRLAPVTMMNLPARLTMRFDSSSQPRFTRPCGGPQTGRRETMRVSMGLPVHDWSACAQAARQAEDGGVDVVTSNELRPEPFSPLAFAALATERVVAQLVA